MGIANAPQDQRGNELINGVECTLLTPFPIVWRVVSVESGGLHTSHGVTPAVVRLQGEIVFQVAPGTRFMNILRTVSPEAQQIVEAVANALPRA